MVIFHSYVSLPEGIHPSQQKPYGACCTASQVTLTNVQPWRPAISLYSGGPVRSPRAARNLGPLRSAVANDGGMVGGASLSLGYNLIVDDLHQDLAI